MSGVKFEINSEREVSSLQQKLDPRRAALLVVDMQNDFCASGGALDKVGANISMAREMVPRLAKFIEQMRKAGYFIVFIRNSYNTVKNLYLSRAWLEQAARKRRGLYVDVPMCVPGTWGADFCGVKPEVTDPVVTKHRFDAFEGTDLDLILRSKKIETLVMTGFATNVCVETTARHGFVKDYSIVIVKDMVSAEARELHEATLKTMELFFGQVVSSDEILGIVTSKTR